MITGSCLCGAVRFEVTGELSSPSACHCSQCRKQSGHFWASANAPRDAVRIEGEEKLRWYQASPEVRRGFCADCGGYLFWEPIGKGRIAIALGSIDGLRIAEPGEFTLRAYSSDREYADARTREYLCFRHRLPDELLTPDHRERVSMLVVEERDGHKYVGRSGVAYGPGFRVIADDWPVGTRIVIAARVLIAASDLPEGDTT